jgi:hypothetical protein
MDLQKIKSIKTDARFINKDVKFKKDLIGKQLEWNYKENELTVI